MDSFALIAALLGAILGGVGGIAVGAALVWFLRPVPPPLVVAPPAPPAVPIDPNLPEAMRNALAQAPDSFASARGGYDIRASMSCVVCKEGTALTCSTCGQRVCMAHQPVDAHPCSVAR